MSNEFIILEYFYPNGFIGFWVLFIGLIFTGIMFYFVFFRLNENEGSYKDRQRKIHEKKKQRDSIARLYPKGY